MQGKVVEDASNRLGYGKPGRFPLLIGRVSSSCCMLTLIAGHRRCTRQAMCEFCDSDYWAKAKREISDAQWLSDKSSRKRA